MGGAFRGLADDWSAVAYNPAGLAFLKSSELNVSLGTYSPQLSYTPRVSEGAVDVGFGQANGRKLYPLKDVWPIPSFAVIAVPSGGKGWALGGAVMWPHDVNYAWDLYRQPVGYASDYAFPDANYRTDLDVLDIHPVAAKTFGKNLAVGAGLSLTNGDLVLRRVLFVPNRLGSTFDAYPYNAFAGDFALDGHGLSIGANAGLLWKATEAVSVGLSVQSPVTVPMSGRASLNMAWPRNQQLANIEMTVLNRAKSFFSGVHDEVNSARFQSSGGFGFDLHLPAQVGAGIGWVASPRVTVALDLAVTFWSAVGSWDISFDGAGLYTGADSNAVAQSMTHLTIPFGWKNQVRVSGGAECHARDNIFIRGGAYYDGVAAVDSTFSPNFPDVGNRIGLTAGIGYRLNGRWGLDAAQEIAFASSRTVASSGAGAGSVVFPGDYALTRYETLASISYRF